MAFPQEWFRGRLDLVSQGLYHCSSKMRLLAIVNETINWDIDGGKKRVCFEERGNGDDYAEMSQNEDEN